MDFRVTTVLVLVRTVLYCNEEEWALVLYYNYY
jgi:hypothetical protein